MKEIRISLILALVAIGLISLVFVALSLNERGLSILNMPLLVAGFGCWLAGLILFVSGVLKRPSGKASGKTIVLTVIALVSFFPLGWKYMLSAGKARTTITVQVTNRLETEIATVRIYGSGDIFENTDTFRVERLRPGEQLKYENRAVTKPHRSGEIRMDFGMGEQAYRKTIAGKFTVNPYQLQQNWEVVIDQNFLNSDATPQ